MKKFINSLKTTKTQIIILSSLVVILLGLQIMQIMKPTKKLDTAGVARIGYINMVQIQVEAKVMKDLNEQNKKYVEALEKDVENKRKEFAKTEESLKKQQATLSPEAFGQKVVQFRNDVMAYDKTTSDKLQAIKASYNEALLEIQQKYLNDIINEVAKDNEYDIVVDANNAKALNSDYDITSEIISKLDKAISSKKMKKEGF